MPFFEKSHSFQIHNAEMNDAQRDVTVNRNTDNRTGGHNFSGQTAYKTREDTYSGSFNGGNFGGNGRGGQGYQGFSSAINTRQQQQLENVTDDFDDGDSDDEEALMREIERKKALLKAKKAERIKKLKAQAAALDAQLAELDQES